MILIIVFAIDTVFKLEVLWLHVFLGSQIKELLLYRQSIFLVLYFDTQDFQVLECIRWEAIIIDECQRSKMSGHSGEIRMLTAAMRLLIISGEIKV